MSKSKKGLSVAKDLVNKYLRTLGSIEVVVRIGDGSMNMLLHPNKLLLISKSHEELYVLNPMKPYEFDRMPEGKLRMLDWLFTIEEVIQLSKKPDRFLSVLTTLPLVRAKMYYIYIDGELAYKSMSGRTWTRTRDQYMKERKVGKITFDHLQTVDPEGKETDFLFNQKDPGVAAVRAEVKRQREEEAKLIAESEE